MSVYLPDPSSCVVRFPFDSRVDLFNDIVIRANAFAVKRRHRLNFQWEFLNFHRLCLRAILESDLQDLRVPQRLQAETHFCEDDENFGSKPRICPGGEAYDQKRGDNIQKSA